MTKTEDPQRVELSHSDGSTSPLLIVPAARRDENRPAVLVLPGIAVGARYYLPLARALADAGVATDIHYATPPHRQPCYNTASSANLRIPEPLTITNQLADTCVSLPVSRCTTPDDARHIADIINAFR